MVNQATGSGEPAGPPGSAAEALARAQRAEEQGDDGSALHAYEEALRRARSDGSGVAVILRRMGSIYRARGETKHAERWYRESLAEAQQTGDEEAQAQALNWLAVMAMSRGEMDEADVQFKRARRLAKRRRLERLQGAIEQNLGIIANIRGDLDGAAVHYRTALRQFRNDDDAATMGLVLNNLGMLHTDLQQWKDAKLMFDDALTLARMTGNRLLENSVHVNVAELHVAQGEWDEALDACERAHEMARARHDRHREAEVMKFRAVVARERDGDYRYAERDLLAAAALAVECQDRLLEAEVIRELGTLYQRQRNVEQARDAYERSLALFQELGAALDSSNVEGRLSTLALSA